MIKEIIKILQEVGVSYLLEDNLFELLIGSSAAFIQYDGIDDDGDHHIQFFNDFGYLEGTSAKYSHMIGNLECDIPELINETRRMSTLIHKVDVKLEIICGMFDELNLDIDNFYKIEKVYGE